MEENNYRNEFELFLKESADEFKMVPSRKVWYSLYNNLHPDKKWPSMAVCLLILTAVLYIGIANNNSLSIAAKKTSSENFSNLLDEKNNDSKITFSAKDYIDPKNKIQLKFSLTINRTDKTEINENPVSTNAEMVTIPDATTDISFLNSTENLITIKTATFLNTIDLRNNPAKSFYQNKANLTKNLIAENENTIVENTEKTIAANTEIIPSKSNDTETLLQKNNLFNIEKSWKEDYAFRNKPAINKFKQNSTFSYYITPSFGYRTFFKSTENTNTAATSPYTTARTNNVFTELFDNPALNLEVGAVLQYSISKEVRFKGGLQANYTNYVSNVTALGHPSQTSLTINNNNNNIRSSNYSTKAGNDKINKTTIQMVLPLGVDFKIAGNGKLNWYAGGTIQPTYVIGGNAFVLSSDEKYYISENALLRKMNLNTSIETFISFKSSNGVVLNVGPQFRYQLLSTYKKEYGYSEKVYNVGIKMGVTTSF